MKRKPEIIFEDAHIVVVGKPPGLLTLPDRYDPAALHLLWHLEQGREKVYVVHRIDRDTSGLVVAALTSEAHRHLSLQFSKRAVHKEYLALVSGTPTWDETMIDFPLLADADRRHRTRIDRGAGKPATTRVSVLERFDQHALVRAVPETGRTHQIRVHLAAAGCPVVGDPLYGDGKPLFLSSFKRGYTRGRREERPLIERTALHAHTLEFVHPGREEAVRYESPLFRDMSASVRQLRKFGSAMSEYR